MVLLKPLDQAIADGDHIFAVIKGSAVNNDGSNKVGYLAPSQEGVAAVVKEALAQSGVDPRTIGFVEAHGTGTALGDPIELGALTQAFRAHVRNRLLRRRIGQNERGPPADRIRSCGFH